MVVQLRTAYDRESFDFRLDNLTNAKAKLGDATKDEFYAKTLDEMIVTMKKQKETYQ